MAFARSSPHYNTFRLHIIDLHIQISIKTQSKCEQYWNEQLDKPYDAGRGFTVVTTGYRGFADYVVRDMTLTRVSLSKNMQSPKHCIQPGINTYNIIRRSCTIIIIQYIYSDRSKLNSFNNTCVYYMYIIHIVCYYDCVLLFFSPLMNIELSV